MISGNHDYLNYDYAEHRIALKEKSWDRKKQLIIFDELHKMKNWKAWLKGIYDVEGLSPALLVTGSARMDTKRKTGDSLAGRYFLFHLHPLDIKEVKGSIDPEEAFDRIMRFGGFPEPFLEHDDSFYGRWKKTHLDIILRQDLLDLESVHSISLLETLIELLKSRVGSPVSYSSLSRDLQKDPKTIKRWLYILEQLYVIFPVRPYHKNIARSILKEPKYYFYDTGQVKGEEGAKLENLAACFLKKETDRLQDCHGISSFLHYVRTKDGKEIDFAVIPESGKPVLIEVKSGDESPNRAFSYFDGFFEGASKVQLVKTLHREKTYPDGTEIRKMVNWLANVDLRELF